MPLSDWLIPPGHWAGAPLWAKALQVGAGATLILLVTFFHPAVGTGQWFSAAGGAWAAQLFVHLRLRDSEAEDDR